MKRILCLSLLVTLAVSATASVDFFFTSSLDPYGLNDPSLAFLHSKGNKTDYLDGYKLSPAGAPPAAVGMPDVQLDCNVGAPPQWAYIWGRFVDEPVGAKINGISINVNGGLPGVGNIAWYSLNNIDDEDIGVKRWDGDDEVFYFNPAGLIAVTAFGVTNRNGSLPWNLYIGGTDRVFLLGAVKCGVCPGEMTLSYGQTPVNYGGDPPPPNPSVRTLNKVVCVPEPASLMLLGLAGLALRRR